MSKASKFYCYTKLIIVDVKSVWVIENNTSLIKKIIIIQICMIYSAMVKYSDVYKMY